MMLSRPVHFQPFTLGLLAVLVIGCDEATPATFTTGGDDTPAVQGTTYEYAFDDDDTTDFISVLGDWEVSSDGALKQGGEFADPDFPRIVLKNLVFEDLTMSVRCRLESGTVDQACGVMFHFVDSDNYMITRANALESNLRLYRVVDGVRDEFASVDLEIAANEWHELDVSVAGDEIVVSWNGDALITEKDTTFAKGKVGLWTKADAITSFDDLTILAQ